MNCYVCTREQSVTPAVAVCRYCGAGLCLVHVEETAKWRPGGMFTGCPHDTWNPRTAAAR